MPSDSTDNEMLCVDKIYQVISTALDAALDNDRDNTVAMTQLTMAEQSARTLAILSKLGFEEDDDTEDSF